MMAIVAAVAVVVDAVVAVVFVWHHPAGCYCCLLVVDAAHSKLQIA